MTPEYKEPVALDPKGLLPCPFCGGAPRGAIYGSGRFAVHCDCHADGPSKWTGGELSGENFERAKADAIAAWNRRASPSVREIGEPVVKELEWCLHGNGIEYADIIVGAYKITKSGAWWLDQGEMEHTGSVEAAKAAAQADFEQRVRSCLSQPTNGEREGDQP